MYSIYSISWVSFFIILLLLLTTAYVSIKTIQGRKYVAKYTFWSVEQWSYLLLIVGLLSFVLVSPITHGILVVLALLLYAIFIVFNRQLRVSGGTSGNYSANDINEPINIICQSDAEMIDGRAQDLLKKAIYSCPYIKQNKKAQIIAFENTYDVQLTLTDQKHLPSLVQYLRKLGFTITHKQVS